MAKAEPDSLSVAMQRIRKLESELDNAKAVILTLSGRALRLELAVSNLSLEARAQIWPDEVAKEQAERVKRVTGGTV